MYIHEIAALGAATCWAIGSLLSVKPSKQLGALRFVYLRMLLILWLLSIYALFSGSWKSIQLTQLVPIALSGLVGICLGDLMLFMAVNRLGPRRAGILFALNAPIAALLGWFFLGEYLSGKTIAGMVICFCGVILAIIFGKNRRQLHEWETVKGPLLVGISFGVLTAAAQAVGSWIARPIMMTDVDPIAVSTLRVAAAVAGLSCLIKLKRVFLPEKNGQPTKEISKPLLLQVVLSGIVGMAIGMTLLLFGLRGGEVGIISTLSATTPAILLPLIWWRSGEKPAASAWMGALLVIIGCGLIFSR